VAGQSLAALTIRSPGQTFCGFNASIICPDAVEFSASAVAIPVHHMSSPTRIRPLCVVRALPQKVRFKIPGYSLRPLIFHPPNYEPTRIYPLHINFHGGEFAGGYPEDDGEFFRHIASSVKCIVWLSRGSRVYVLYLIFPFTRLPNSRGLHWAHSLPGQRWHCRQHSCPPSRQRRSILLVISQLYRKQRLKADPTVAVS
jgi:hypothetical protein